MAAAEAAVPMAVGCGSEGNAAVLNETNWTPGSGAATSGFSRSYFISRTRAKEVKEASAPLHLTSADSTIPQPRTGEPNATQPRMRVSSLASSALLA